MSDKKYNITGGVYLVVDPTMEWNYLFYQLEQALDSRKIAVVQIWNYWKNISNKEERITEIIRIAQIYDVPVFINEDWELLRKYPLAGIHFDSIPTDFESIKTAIGRPFLSGITLSNNLSVLEWAEKNGCAYVSFCSVFPSASAGSCELVRPETLIAARQMTRLPLFVSGGLTIENMSRLPGNTFDGIAIISGIMKHPEPATSALNFHKALSRFKQLLTF
jgi:thiamine-phosphate pyrophosphorylase